jgi:hypothetical protein
MGIVCLGMRCFVVSKGIVAIEIAFGKMFQSYQDDLRVIQSFDYLHKKAPPGHSCPFLQKKADSMLNKNAALPIAATMYQ